MFIKSFIHKFSYSNSKINPLVKFTKRKYSDECITMIKSIPNENRIGIFAKRRIMNDETIFVEDPIISAQSTLNKKFVQACQNCMKHISVHRDNILDFLPESAAPFLPKRSNSQFAFQINDERKVYCSAECFDHSFRNYIEVLSPFSESIKKPYEQYKAIEEQWSEFLPIVPLEMIFKAICLEILNLNPNLNSVADRSQLKDKNKLKCLSSYSHSQVSVDPMKELIISVTAVANKIFRPFCPFVITEHTIKDAISRLANNCIYFNLASPSPIEIYLASSVVRSKEDVEKINKIEDQLILNGNGNIKSIWHPTGFGLYENISILKRTDDYNASILYNETHQVELIACRTIERNEEITISTRINVQT